jgi:hypothetical protein
MKAEIFLGHVNRIVFDDLGVSPTWQKPYGSICMDDFTRTWVDLGKFKINPKMTGPLAPMFVEIMVEVTAAYDPDKKIGMVRYHYMYRHPGGGRKRYTVRKTFEH